MGAALGQSLSPEMSEEAQAELEAMEADYGGLEAAEQLPTAPKVRNPLAGPTADPAACDKGLDISTSICLRSFSNSGRSEHVPV